MTNRLNTIHKLTAFLVCCMLALLQFAACGAPASGKTASPDPTKEQSAETPAPVSPPSLTDDLILFVNVGKADATVIRSAGDFYLVDTGTAESVPALFGAMNYLGAESVKGVFITHSHSDHVGGLSTLLSHYPVETVYRADISDPKEGKRNPADKAAEKAGKKTVLLSAGETIGIGGENTAAVLGPLVLNTDDDNDNSLVLDLRLNGTKILLAGDMQFAEEETLLDRYGDGLKTDILRAGNHGNPDATGPAFAEATDPQTVVISTDRTVDTDSANERVLNLFSGKEILITDESDLGYLLSFENGGKSVIRNIREETGLQLMIEEIDKETQTAVIRNNGPEADLSGCMLFSEKGNELFVFPDGAVLAAGGSCTVSGENGNGDFRWPGEKKPWNQKKDDRALLFDRFGNLLHALN